MMDELHGLKNYRIATEEDRKGPKPEGTMWLSVSKTWRRSTHVWESGFTYAVPIPCPLEGWEECTEKEWGELNCSESFYIPGNPNRYFRRKRVSQTITAELCGDEVRYEGRMFREAK